MQGPIARLLGEKLVGVEVPRNEADGSFTRDSTTETLTLVMKEEEGKTYRDKAKEMTTIVKLTIVELSQKKWPCDTFLLAVRSREDHISGFPGGTNNFSSSEHNLFSFLISHMTCLNNIHK